MQGKAADISTRPRRLSRPTLLSPLSSVSASMTGLGITLT